MSQVLTVPTHFDDIGELSEGFLDRVEQDTLILYGPVPYEDGSEVEFAILLADGSAALEGKGRVRAAVDGGAERVPETRYDVVVEALELAGRSEVVFERLVMARQAVSEPAPADDADAVVADDADAVVADDADAEALAADEATEEEAAAVDDETPEVEVATEEVVVATDEVIAAADEVEVAADEVVAAAELVSIRPEEVRSLPPNQVEEDAAANDEEPTEMSAADERDEWPADTDDEPQTELSIDAQETLEKYASAHEGPVATEEAFDALVASDQSFHDALQGEVDEDGQPLVAAEPNVGAPVPKPSMAAPPEAPPAPAGLNLVPPPEGLTRPSRAAVEEELLASFDEVSGEEEHSGLFEYKEGLPIPSRPPLPDLQATRAAPRVEANDNDDVEDSEPPEAHDDYEEIRLSELAESAEEG